MTPTKITLSPAEQQLVTNAGWILTKNAVIGKVYNLFGELSERYDGMLSARGIGEDITGKRAPKISKGEQYEGLPWVMLDHPRHFAGDDMFAVRSFFWWGNFCSISFLAGGRFKDLYGQKMLDHILLHPRTWLLCTGSDPWAHHLRDAAEHTVPERVVHDLPFLKVARRFSLDQWDVLPELFSDAFAEILGIIAE